MAVDTELALRKRAQAPQTTGRPLRWPTFHPAQVDQFSPGADNARQDADPWTRAVSQRAPDRSRSVLHDTPTLVITLRRVPLTEAAAESLSDAELARAARYRSQSARAAFIAVRSALRCALAEQLAIPAADIPLSTDAFGRPTTPGAAFNVSHSGELGLIAIADAERRIGVDIEHVRTVRDVEGLAQRFLHPAEAARIGADSWAFLRCWTLKEAVVKAIGHGLSADLRSFAVDIDAREFARIDGVPDLVVTAIAVEDGYLAALAADEPMEYRWAR